MKSLIKATLLVTILTVVGQTVSFIIQMETAALFGAGTGMDAFLAASAVPQYVITVLLGSLGVVFVPVFIHYLAIGKEDEAWKVASSVINLTLLGLGILVLVGVLFPDTILRLSAPGLPENTRQQAVQMAKIIWPGVLGTAVILLLTGIYQSQSHFGWPAAVPVIGALLSLVLMVVLAGQMGIMSLAIASTVGIFLQAVLLVPFVLKFGHYQFAVSWRHSGVWQILHLLMPLLLANIVVKITPLIDRFFASQMPEGSISHLGYAFRIFSVVSVLISTGISTVIFPRMASNAAGTEFSELRKTMSAGLRVMWVAIAPVMTIGLALSLPLVLMLFQRGEFNNEDAVVVAGLIQIYLLALPPACLGTVTGRGFYALKDTRTLAILGSIESVAYVLYTAILAESLGVYGIALGYVIYFNISLLWQVVILRFKLGNSGGRTLVDYFLRTGLGALLGGVAAWSVTFYTSSMWVQLIFGGFFGLSVFLLSMWILNHSEIWQMWKSLRAL